MHSGSKIMKYNYRKFETEWEAIEPIAEHIGALLYELNIADHSARNKRMNPNLAGIPFETVLKAWREIVWIQFKIKAGDNVIWGGDMDAQNFMPDLKQDVWDVMTGGRQTRFESGFGFYEKGY